MHTLTREDVRLPRRRKSGHKGDHGRVFVIGGSEEFVGAVALAGLAALRSGCDLVVVAAPSKVAWAVNCLSPDLITKKLPGKGWSERHFLALKRLARTFDVLLIGNGIGTSVGARRLVEKLCTLPNRKVLDADAIKMVSSNMLSDTIITPHEKEFEIFLKNSGRTSRTLGPFLARGNVVLRKGRHDTILAKGKSARNTTGNAGMTKGGTGDVLAGICAGYLAQGNSPWQAACNSAYTSGRIGDLLKRKHKGYTYLASDMVEEIHRFSRRR